MFFFFLQDRPTVLLAALIISACEVKQIRSTMRLSVLFFWFLLFRSTPFFMVGVSEHYRSEQHGVPNHHQMESKAKLALVESNAVSFLFFFPVPRTGRESTCYSPCQEVLYATVVTNNVV